MTSLLPPIPPHTKAKHHILQYHLNEWFPILGRSYGRLQYIDGFAGPGEYEGGDQGSPILALNIVSRHLMFETFAREGKRVEFLFVDKNQEYCRHLQGKIDEHPWPSAFDIEVKHGEFEDALKQYLDSLASRNKPIPPTLLFVDPFGPAGFSMDLLGRLASFDRVDVLINLNCLDFIRWILPDSSKHITANELYGGERWRPALDLNGQERIDFLVAEYERALHDIGWRGTSFEMVNRQNQTAYHLIFGTGHPKGMEAIKRAMRHASQTGEFRYTDRIDRAQPVLVGLALVNEFPKQIGEHLFQKYDGQEVAFDLLLEEEINWHRLWLPPDLRNGLIHLEFGDDPRIVNVRNSDGRRRIGQSYPAGCYITFGRPQQSARPQQGQLL